MRHEGSVVLLALVLLSMHATTGGHAAIAAGDGAIAAAQDPAIVETALDLDRPTRRLIQQELRNEGFDPGTPDGLFGPRTRAAIRDWQPVARSVTDRVPVPRGGRASSHGRRPGADVGSFAASAGGSRHRREGFVGRGATRSSDGGRPRASSRRYRSRPPERHAGEHRAAAALPRPARGPPCRPREIRSRLT